MDNYVSGAVILNSDNKRCLILIQLYFLSINILPYRFDRFTPLLVLLLMNLRSTPAEGVLLL